jgi:Ca2+-binding RTX toxin-like protein
MHHLDRRARRALTPLALTALVAAAAPAVADAAGPRPRVDVRVRQRTLIVEGGRADDTIRLYSPAATPFNVVVALGLEGEVVVASVHRDRFDDVVVRGGDGNDLILVDEVPGEHVPFTDTKPTSIRGERGHDVVSSGRGAEELRGGAGRDVIDGNGGNDVIALGAGDDQIIWDPGDGSDLVEGGAGLDNMTFNGAAINETFAAAADGERLRFTRVQGNIVMDTDGVEEVTVNTLGGSDFTEVGDLSRTDVTVVGVDDGAIAGGDGPDAVIDTVSVVGTTRADHFTLTGGAGLVHVQGPSTRVDVVDLSTLDALNVITDRGADTIDASAVAADAAHLGLLSGAGNDLVLGGAGLDEVLAGPGRDVVDANRGDDRISLDEGDDEIIWDPGDGSDLVDGAAGFDVMTFNGAGGDEVMDASALDDGLIFTRDVGNIRMDTERLEQLDVNALGGADTVAVGDLSGTTVEIVALDLAAVRGTPGADGVADHVVVRGTPGDDIVTAFGAAGAARIDHLPWSIDIVNSEPLDLLTIDGNGGDDTIDTAGLGPDTIQPAPDP